MRLYTLDWAPIVEKIIEKYLYGAIILFTAIGRFPEPPSKLTDFIIRFVTKDTQESHALTKRQPRFQIEHFVKLRDWNN